jgi:hypothetical protein
LPPSSCKQCPTDSVEPCPRRDVHFGNYVPFNCGGPNQYNPLATLFFNTQVTRVECQFLSFQDNAIRSLFSLFSSNTDGSCVFTLISIVFTLLTNELLSFQDNAIRSLFSSNTDGSCVCTLVSIVFTLTTNEFLSFQDNAIWSLFSSNTDHEFIHTHIHCIHTDNQ